MDVNRADAVTPAGAGSGPKKERKRAAEEEQKDKGADEHAQQSPWTGTEAFAMDGLLASGLTPEMQKAFDGLVRQIEPLRAEVERARGRETHLKDLAEKHSFLPVPNRREFLRELSHVLQNIAHLAPPPSLMVLHLVNADEMRRRFGRRALDGLLAHTCGVLESRLNSTDVIGSLGGNDLGIILLVGNHERARAKTMELTEALAAQPFHWQGSAVAVEVAVGIAALTSAMAPDGAVEAADRELTGGLMAAAGNTAKPAANG